MKVVTDADTIVKKAFLGRRDLVTVALPAQITTIEDWAFANCTRLEQVQLYPFVTQFGKKVFYQCDRLKRIEVIGSDAEQTRRNREAAELVAIAFLTFTNAALTQLSEVASDAWIKDWDDTLLRYLQKPDEDGFAPFLAGGEEDYEQKENDIGYYCHWKRMQKVSFVVKRLLKETVFFIQPEVRKEFVDYLHNGMDTYTETFDFLCQETENCNVVFQLYETLQLFAGKNIEKLLNRIEPSKVELRALLMRKMTQETVEETVWDRFSL